MPVFILIAEIRIMCEQLYSICENMTSDQYDRLYHARDEIRNIIRELGGVRNP